MTCPMWTDGENLRERIVEMRAYDEGTRSVRIFGKRHIDKHHAGRNDHLKNYVSRKPVTIGWTTISEGWKPGVVLDPFAGTGTTGVAALKMGRSFIGIDLYPELAVQAQDRCAETLQWMRSKRLNPFEFVEGVSTESDTNGSVAP